MTSPTRHLKLRGTDNPALAFEHAKLAMLLRKLQSHHRASALFALDADVPAVIAHDSLHNHQPQTVTAGLCGVIWREELGQVLGFDSIARI